MQRAPERAGAALGNTAGRGRLGTMRHAAAQRSIKRKRLLTVHEARGRCRCPRG